jgi:hypothetical protein
MNGTVSACGSAAMHAKLRWAKFDETLLHACDLLD